jgi:hypothetical protein
MVKAAVDALFAELGCWQPDGLVDPSGTVLDTNGNPVRGATATILRADTAAGPFTPVDPDQPGIEPAVDPETTGRDGVFHWDVRAGYYDVQASAPGCTAPGDPGQPTATIGPYPVPPPQLGLTITLACPDEAPAPRPVVTSLSVGTGGRHGARPTTPRPLPAWYGSWSAWRLHDVRLAHG